MDKGITKGHGFSVCRFDTDKKEYIKLYEIQ